MYIVASGELRPSANVKCWPTQQRLEADLEAALGGLGWKVRRGHPFDQAKSTGSLTASAPGSARHKENHVNLIYAPDSATADKALTAKAALFAEIGLHVHLCGDVRLS